MKVTFNKVYLLIMEFISLIKLVIVVSWILVVLKEKESIKKGIQLFRVNSNKTYHIKIVIKKDKIMSFKDNIKMEDGKKEY